MILFSSSASHSLYQILFGKCWFLGNNAPLQFMFSKNVLYDISLGTRRLPFQQLLLSQNCRSLPLIRTLYCWVLSKEISNTILKIFGMTRPGIEPRSPGPWANTRPLYPHSQWACIVISTDTKFALIDNFLAVFLNWVFGCPDQFHPVLQLSRATTSCLL